MIRTKTAVIVGAGAAVEIELPGQREMLSRIAQGFDFQRLGGDLETQDMQDFDALFRQVKGKAEILREAAQRIRAGARLSSSIHALLQQHGDDKHVLVAGKLAIAYHTLKAEEHSAMAAEPRDPGDMPFRGVENWLFQLGRMVVDGVARARAENCFDNLHIVNFNTDRAIEHYMPFVLHSGFGMPVTEAQELCAQKLKVMHPYGRAGRLEWESGAEAEAGWGEPDRRRLFKVAEGIRTMAELADDRQFRAALTGGIANARRLVFLGFDFNPFDTSLLIQERLSHAPDTLVALPAADQPKAETIRRVLRTHGGIAPDMLAAFHGGQSWQMLSDNALLIES